VGSSSVEEEVAHGSPEDEDTCCEGRGDGTGPVVEVGGSACRKVGEGTGNLEMGTGPKKVI
jgi:hypothetical protein